MLQKAKNDGLEQIQVFIEPKGTHLLEKDAWKEQFLLQMKDSAVPVTLFVDDNDYRIWGFHFFNQDTRMREIDVDFDDLMHSYSEYKKGSIRYSSETLDQADSTVQLNVAEELGEYDSIMNQEDC